MFVTENGPILRWTRTVGTTGALAMAIGAAGRVLASGIRPQDISGQLTSVLDPARRYTSVWSPGSVPVISSFFGITIRMYHDDHPPPHIHAEYQGYEAFVSIDTGDVLEGQLPTKAAAIVREWCLVHQRELVQNWENAQAFGSLERIRGADHD